MREQLWIPARPGFKSLDDQPDKTVRQKILEIKKSRVDIRKSRQYSSQLVYTARLCHTKGVSFQIDSENADVALIDFDIGDKRLYGHGIGTRMLERVIAYGLRREPGLKTVSRAVGNWALVRTMGKVLGGNEQVSFERGGQTYGYGGDRPIEAVLEDHPHEDSTQDYLVNNVVGQIDGGLLLGREEAERAVRIYINSDGAEP